MVEALDNPTADSLEKRSSLTLGGDTKEEPEPENRLPIYTISDDKGSSSTLDMVSLNSATTSATVNGDLENNKVPDDDIQRPKKEEKWWSTLIQVAVPFFIAGIGTIGAGLVLGHVQEWDVFKNVSAIFVLVPSLSGLKGNLDMCLASRLSTQANLGKMTSVKEITTMVVGNISLVQVQAIVAAIIVAVFAIAVNAIIDQEFSINNALLLTSAAVFTATTTCFVLDFVLVSVILISHNFKMNPDNVATPLAASIGDVVSITVLSITASYLYKVLDDNIWLPCVIIGLYLLILPVWIYVVLHNIYTKPVLTTGWTPVISALFISGLGGMILDQAVDNFSGFVVFQPIVNGIGGNLVSVQASRISTMLHRGSLPGILPEGTRVWDWPWRVLFYGTQTSKIARMLLALAFTGQIVFMFAADYMYQKTITIGVAFGFAYVICSTVQVMVLLYIAHIIVHQMWKCQMDPDNSAIPYLTSLGDLLGSIFLGLAFFILALVGQEYEK
ncbi:solute carrier family 41 member 2-like [Arctopsyche grandis]|uniref:solute carrier family 41 member 2-like n=1 Tax=Arctopsyche grandis TaxID=121162 RepID=UPI00406D9C33